MHATTLELLEDDLIRLPKDIIDSELGNFLHGRYDEFQQAITGLEDAVGDEMRPKRAAISTLCDGILDAVAAFPRWGMDSAIAAISLGLEAVRPDLVTIARHNEETVLRGQSLHRIRDSKNVPLSQPVELFHLPFQLRHLAPSVRHSVDGAPCLYLANSIFTCWKECRLPEISECATDRLDSIYAARFEFTRSPLLLDFCYPPWALAHALDALERPLIAEFARMQQMNAPIGPDLISRVGYLASWLAVWPLLLAVSLRTRSDDPADGAKPEYLVPQMLMAWVQRSLKFDGIRYFSTRELPGNNDNDYAIDYAFPVKTSMESGHCKVLGSLFLCTPPVKFGLVAGASISKMLSPDDWARAESNSRRYVIVDQDGIRHYYGTTYCDIEYVLDVITPQCLG